MLENNHITLSTILFGAASLVLIASNKIPTVREYLERQKPQNDEYVNTNLLDKFRPQSDVGKLAGLFMIIAGISTVGLLVYGDIDRAYASTSMLGIGLGFYLNDVI
ncbi:hypothetical protein KC717_06320 [Candidatus Dojkabacteria bacterium]|uniref:Uncharacterized protein n=1 Tax=Candidatus Dojkabacteria bacterium TaxID=2099670 RepID=A0A955RLE5_9BACT|nr:hypothetical protein [Candidatus Dojkabacteria bacterium]